MIELAKFGTQSLGKSYYPWKSTRMWSILWLLIILMGKRNDFEFNCDRDKIVTGSFDRTAKIWDANTG